MNNLNVERKQLGGTTLLAGTVVTGSILAGLYWAQTVIVPIALALFLAFLLAPLVSALQRCRLRRTFSVVVVVLLAAIVMGSVTWAVKSQLASLVHDIPTYTENIQGKIKYVRELTDGVDVARLVKFGQDIAGEWAKDATVESTPSESLSALTTSDVKTEPNLQTTPETAAAEPVVSSWLTALALFFSAMLASLGGLALAMILVVFMLIEREALRNRLIWVIGNGRMTETTKALDDAGSRISRYLLMQLIVNGSYGMTWGLGLYIIGVDYALLWGFLAAVLRYVPYLGAPIAALLPLTLSLAQFPGWTLPLIVLTLLLVLELISNNVIEPLLYGHSIGVSPVGMLIAAAFWTFLWGPIGLVLSGPLTVCLVVLGKHVPRLRFFAVLLGDAPALDADVSYYQRLVAKDQDEAAHLITAQMKSSTPELVYDEMLIPALVYTKRDRERDLLSNTDVDFIVDSTQEILDDLETLQTAKALRDVQDAGALAVAPPRSCVRILACPSRDKMDRLALNMLRQVLDPSDWEVETTAPETLTAEIVDRVGIENSVLICIAALPPGGLSHARYLCKRLRARHPALKIIVGRWGLVENIEENRTQLREAGATFMATSLLETRKLLQDWLPVLVIEHNKVPATVEPILIPSS